jgi:hypothetical protein
LQKTRIEDEFTAAHRGQIPAMHCDADGMTHNSPKGYRASRTFLSFLADSITGIARVQGGRHGYVFGNRLAQSDDDTGI